MSTSERARPSQSLPDADSTVDWDSYTSNAAVPSGASSSDDPIDASSGASDSTDGYDYIDGEYDSYDNSTMLGDGRSPSSSGSDSAGNTIFFLAIVAFIATALGLGFFLWRKHNQNKSIGKGVDMKGSMFSNGKKRPSPLPLTQIRTAEDGTTLPPYSPYLHSAYGQAAAAAAAATTPVDHASAAGSDASSQARNATLARLSGQARKSQLDKNGALFSPFAPFSPVSAAAPAADPEKGEAGALDDDEEDIEAIKPRRKNRYAVNLPTPTGIRFMDPEAAQAMGIHPSVVKEAESGISDAEIERRRARAQRKLEAAQRADEGSVVEDDIDDTPSFKQLASRRKI